MPMIEKKLSRKRSASEISDVDHSLIGLSPQYWSYTPVLICDLVGLPLINGLDCFVKCNHVSCDCEDVELNKNNQVKEGDSDIGSCRILPLSRVLLKGIATAIDRRPNGCTLIVLDDGTGSIDCRYWDNSHSGNNAHNLPPLLPKHDTINSCRQSRFAVGDSLEVTGKIKALTTGVTNDKCKLLDSFANPLEARFGCVREVHATSMCSIGDGQTRKVNQRNGEVVHWLKCIEFSHMVAAGVGAGGKDIVRNSKDVLPLLGDTTASSIFGCSGNTMDKKNILERKCCQTPSRFRSALFYCHCEATLEALDISFHFRNSLLHRLLDMEAQLQHSSDSSYPSATEDCMDLIGVPESMPPPLLFTFEFVYKDEHLASIARNVTKSTSSPEANAQRLVRKTFAAMADDGILSLFHEKDDLYLLVSRTRVIEPFLRFNKERKVGCFGAVTPSPEPFFIRSVPRMRIVEITNWIGQC